MLESLDDYLQLRTALVEDTLQRWIGPRIEWPDHLHRAMHYSLFPGGKRLRPVLAMAGYEAVATVPDSSMVLPFACALELLHTYTLIHDDLPQMDDDDLRRGRPTNHRVFGEALAILAGDALQALAIQWITDRRRYPTSVDPMALLDVAHDLALASGEDGVVGGQSMDLGYEGEVKAVEHVAFLSARKTGVLIRCAIVGGARLGGADPTQLNALTIFGDRIGLAFQITDDLLDDMEPSAVRHPERPRIVPSIVELMGERQTREWCGRVVEEALAALDGFDDRAEPLRALARWIPTRRS